jgi:hypothetical protein
MMALFQDLGSAPASMAAARMLDFIASLPGCREGQTDAVRAYTQALLKGIETLDPTASGPMTARLEWDVGSGCSASSRSVRPPGLRIVLGTAL